MQQNAPFQLTKCTLQCNNISFRIEVLSIVKKRKSRLVRQVDNFVYRMDKKCRNFRIVGYDYDDHVRVYPSTYVAQLHRHRYFKYSTGIFEFSFSTYVPICTRTNKICILNRHTLDGNTECTILTIPTTITSPALSLADINLWHTDYRSRATFHTQRGNKPRYRYPFSTFFLESNIRRAQSIENLFDLNREKSFSRVPTYMQKNNSNVYLFVGKTE